MTGPARKTSFQPARSFVADTLLYHGTRRLFGSGSFRHDDYLEGSRLSVYAEILNDKETIMTTINFRRKAKEVSYRAQLVASMRRNVCVMCVQREPTEE